MNFGYEATKNFGSNVCQVMYKVGKVPIVFLRDAYRNEHLLWDLAALVAGVVLLILNPYTFGLGVIVGYGCSDTSFDNFIKKIERFAFRWHTEESGFFANLSITPVISFFLFAACLPYSFSVAHIYCSIKLGQYIYDRDFPKNQFDNSFI